MSEDPVYLVESIVEKKLESGVEKFKIRWKNYLPEDDTWETEDCFIDSYDLILWFEQTEFLQKYMNQPVIKGLKIFKGRFKLLVEWERTKENQYYYSNAIARFRPDLVISYYESLIVSEPTSDHEYDLDALAMIRENQQIEKVVAAIRIKQKSIFLVSIKDEDEAVFVDEETIKLKYPLLLIEFYEGNFFMAV